jgi:hypothetical protein
MGGNRGRCQAPFRSVDSHPAPRAINVPSPRATRTEPVINGPSAGTTWAEPVINGPSAGTNRPRPLAGCPLIGPRPAPRRAHGPTIGPPPYRSWSATAAVPGSTMTWRASGGIGRREGFRCLCPWAWGFESPLAHRSPAGHRPGSRPFQDRLLLLDTYTFDRCTQCGCHPVVDVDHTNPAGLRATHHGLLAFTLSSSPRQRTGGW